MTHIYLDIGTIASAAPGWRVVFLRSRAPWVEEQPVLCWALRRVGDTGATFVEPMVLAKNGVSIELPAGGCDYRIARPGDPPDKWIEEAREAVRARRRWARKNKQTAKPGGGEARPKPRKKKVVHAPPARRTNRIAAVESVRRRQTSGVQLDELGRAEGSDVLCDFFELGCKIGKREEVGATALYDAYRDWAKAFGVQPVERVRVTMALKEIGAEGVKRGSRYEHWRGISLLGVEPPVPERGEGEEAKAERLEMIEAFARSHARKSSWSNTHSEKLFACYRSWCRQRGLCPGTRREVLRVMKRLPGFEYDELSEGMVMWKGVNCRWPEASRRRR